MKWILQKPEQQGTYRFNGTFYVTNRVHASVKPEDVAAIYQATRQRVEAENGLDYLQVFEHYETGEKLFFIDQLTEQQVDSKKFKPEENHCTLMFTDEH